MAISGTTAVALVVSTALGTWGGWKLWNRRMRAEMDEELKGLKTQRGSTAGPMKKFLLGSEKFGFFYGRQEAECRFFYKRPDGIEVECSFPVAALRTAAINTLLLAVFAAAQVAPPPDAKLAQFAQEVQKTVVEHSLS